MPPQFGGPSIQVLIPPYQVIEIHGVSNSWALSLPALGSLPCRREQRHQRQRDGRVRDHVSDPQYTVRPVRKRASPTRPTCSKIPDLTTTRPYGSTMPLMPVLAALAR